MFEQRRWPPEAWIPIGAGMLWLWFAASFGLVGFLFSLIPGALLLTSGVSTLLYPGDDRITQFTALGGLLGVPLAVPSLWVGGPLIGLALIAVSAISFVASGYISVHQEPHTEEVPQPRKGLRLAVQVAFDEFLLATMNLTLPIPRSQDLPRIRDEVIEAREQFGDHGWLEKPVDYHRSPPPLEQVAIQRSRSHGLDYEHLRFESGYEPHPGEPGRERWLGLRSNRTAHAYALRHAATDRPWLVCIHGYQMGAPFIDFDAFQAARLHHTYGLNLLLPVLPLHGPRKEGRRSGDGYLRGDHLDTIHAVSQAMWDIRRLLGWVREQGGDRVGVHGLSLGGFHTAMLACLDDDLRCAVPGIPLADVSRALWRHGPPLHMRYVEHHGLVHDAVAEVLQVISPLVLEPRVAKERRYIFGAVADRLVPPDHVRDLWRHWDRPRIEWYQGGHVSFRYHPRIPSLLDEALRESGLREG